jgi:plastocyanin
MTKLLIACGAAAALLLVSCGGSKEEAKKEDTAAPAAAPAAAVDDANAATVTGKGRFQRRKAHTAHDRYVRQSGLRARSHHGAEVGRSHRERQRHAAEHLRVDQVRPAGQTVAGPPTTVSLEQDGCMYKPHVIGVMTGQGIEIKNDDATNHNIHPLPKINQEWNESQPPKGDPKTKSFAREEVLIPVKCNVHPWMRAYIGVVSHPFFAVTGEDGTFTIKGLPPGKYTLEAVHEKYGTKDIEITVGPKESKTQDFTMGS